MLWFPEIPLSTVIMFNSDLLEQEEAYHKLNAELELKTRQLMKDVESVMNKQSNPKLWEQTEIYKGFDDIENSYSRARSAFSIYGNNSPVSDVCSDPLECQFYKHSGKSFNRTKTRKKDIPCNFTRSVSHKNDDVIPASAKGMSSESLIRFLKAKVKLLQEELNNSKKEYARRTEEWRKFQIEMKTFEEEKLKLLGDLANAKEKLKKQELTIASVNERLALRDSENSLLKKQIDLLKHDVKKMNLSSSGSEAKLNKAKEEVEKLKILLKRSQGNEKEARDKCRAKDEEMVQAVRRLEKQKAELVNGLKKKFI